MHASVRLPHKAAEGLSAGYVATPENLVALTRKTPATATGEEGT